MHKNLLLILIILTSNQLFCAESAELKKAVSDALCAAAHPSKRFLFEIKPSNQVTQVEADEHETLIDTVFKRDTAEKTRRKELNIQLAVPQTFLYELNKKRDVIISAYETKEGSQKKVLVGGLFGTKHRNQNENPFGFIDVFMLVNGIYVANDIQRQGIGTQMVRLFQDYKKSLPLALCVKITNAAGIKFWNSQAKFKKAPHTILDYTLLRSYDDSRAQLERQEIVTYYSENDRGELLMSDSSDDEV